MEILIPGLRAVVTHIEYAAGLGEEFPELYISTVDGKIMKRSKLLHGRQVMLDVDRIPVAKKDHLPELKRDFTNFFPNGEKVPYQLLDDIVRFFQAFMANNKMVEHATGNHSYEAMAHIVWNPTSGYRVAIPTQRVSAAHVHYEWDHLVDGDVVIVDIHSHNTMGAFFSGTDNGDDVNKINFSGVIGRLNTQTPEMKWRFNDLATKYEGITLHDIFTKRVEDASVPKEWMDKVTIGYGGYGGNYGNYGAGYYGNNRGAGRGGVGGNVGKSQQETLAGKPSPRSQSVDNESDVWGHGSIFEDYGLAGYDDYFGYPIPDNNKLPAPGGPGSSMSMDDFDEKALKELSESLGVTADDDEEEDDGSVLGVLDSDISEIEYQIREVPDEPTPETVELLNKTPGRMLGIPEKRFHRITKQVQRDFAEIVSLFVEQLDVPDVDELYMDMMEYFVIGYNEEGEEVAINPDRPDDSIAALVPCPRFVTPEEVAETLKTEGAFMTPDFSQGFYITGKEMLDAIAAEEAKFNINIRGSKRLEPFSISTMPENSTTKH